MAKFRYRMQNILNIKEKLEEQEKQKFAVLRQKLTEEEQLLAHLEEKKELLAQEARRMREDKLNILEIKENTAAREYMDDQIKQQLMRVRIAEKNLDAARMRMQRAMQERKVQEKLKEHAFEEFLQEENRNELKEIDELTSYVYGKK